MPEYRSSPVPPSADEPTDTDVARYILERCRELTNLTDHLDNDTIARLLLEIIDRTKDFLNENDGDDA